MIPLLFLIGTAFFLFSCAEHGGRPEDWNQSFEDGDLDLETAAETETDSDLETETEQETETETEEPRIWAMKFAIAYTTVIPVINRKVQMILSGVARTPFEKDGSNISFTENICDFSMNIVEDIDFQVIFTEESIRAIPIKPRLATLSGDTPGSRFRAEHVLDIYGADEALMDDPVNDPLPTEPDDPLLVDFENDGHPALTGRLNGFVQGEVYVVLRMLRSLDGELVTEDFIEGEIDSTVEMVTIGASSPLLKIQLDLRRVYDPDLNHFQAVRIPADMSCEELYAREAEFFSYDPMDYAVPLGEQEEEK